MFPKTVIYRRVLLRRLAMDGMEFLLAMMSLSLC